MMYCSFSSTEIDTFHTMLRVVDILLPQVSSDPYLCSGSANVLVVQGSNRVRDRPSRQKDIQSINLGDFV
jgi:hypothetical protein